MPNGKPGDHPLNDIVVHRMDLIGGGVDDEVRNIVSEFGEIGRARMDEFVISPVFGGAEAIIEEQRKLLRNQLIDIWNDLILARRAKLK